MAVYDKELIINGEAVRSPEQQVFKNMKDIQALKEKIKNVYSTSVTTLTSSSVSIATANVDGLGTATEGWLLDPNGLLFKITANDGTTTTLQYYSDLKGPQGESGAAVNIDDTGTAVDKCWSSNKTNSQINTEVAKAKDKGIYWTSTLPTPNDGTYTYNKLDLSNINTNIPFKTGDLIVYVDMTDSDNPVVSKMLQMDDVSDPDYITAIALGDIGGGKQLYQHNILVYNSTAKYLTFSLQFISDSNTPITSTTDLETWLYNNGFYLDDHNDKFMPACGQMEYNSVYYVVNGVNYNTYQNKIRCRGFKENAIQNSQLGANFVLEDVVIPL